MEAWVTLATNDAYRYFQLLVIQIMNFNYPENFIAHLSINIPSSAWEH